MINVRLKTPLLHSMLGKVRMKLQYAIIVLLAVMAASQGCRDFTASGKMPHGVPDPEHLRNPEGAQALSISAQYSFQVALASAILEGGLLTDELQSFYRGDAKTIFSPGIHNSNLIDSRNTTATSGVSYGNLHIARAAASQAIGSLSGYAPELKAIRGLMYAYAAYAEVMLADLYCSGVPLSTLDFERDFTVKPGSSTADIYRHAIALFDSAILLASDSLPVVHFANTGKARALLALARYDEAGLAVSEVPVDFVWFETLHTCDSYTIPCSPLSVDGAVQLKASLSLSSASVSNGESGLTAITIGSQRIQAELLSNPPGGTHVSMFPVYHPSKYSRNGPSQIHVATGLEAQLILAEAALNRKAPAEWLSILQDLRDSDSRTVMLPPLNDPGNEDERIEMLFSERAKWLFLTGHRQGDLRRMVRQYHRPQSEVYPWGVYPGGIARYGAIVNLPIPESEGNNPLFEGCFNREA